MDKIKTVRSYSSLRQHCVLINYCEFFEKNLKSQEHKNKELEEKVSELEEERRKCMGRETVSSASNPSSLQTRGGSSRPPPSPALRQLPVHRVASGTNNLTTTYRSERGRAQEYFVK